MWWHRSVNDEWTCFSSNGYEITFYIYEDAIILKRLLLKLCYYYSMAFNEKFKIKISFLKNKKQRLCSQLIYNTKAIFTSVSCYAGYGRAITPQYLSLWWYFFCIKSGKTPSPPRRTQTNSKPTWSLKLPTIDL